MMDSALKRQGVEVLREEGGRREGRRGTREEGREEGGARGRKEGHEDVEGQGHAAKPRTPIPAQDAT